MQLTTLWRDEKAALKRSLKRVAGLSILASLCLLITPLYLFQVYDTVLLSRSFETLGALTIVAVILLFTFAVLDVARSYMFSKISIRLDERMAGPLIAAEMARQSDANKQSINDLAAMRSVISSPLMGAIFDLPTLPIYLLITFLIHPALGLLVLVGAATMILLTIYSSRATKARVEDASNQLSLSSKALEQQLTQQELVRSAGLYREAVNDWGQHHAKALTALVESQVATGTYGAVSKTLRQFIQIALIGLGAALVLWDQATPGVIFAASIIGGRALQPIDQMIGGWRQIKGALDSLRRFEARLEDLALPTDRTQLPRPKGRIGLERVIYMPRPGTPPIIKGITLVIEPGDAVAMIGPSGSGKTTLARMMVGYLEPVSGKVTLDGQDTKTWDPVARGLHVGYMPQRIEFFEASIRDNIARLRREDAPELAIQAAQTVGIHDMIMRFPEGYDTKLSRGGFWPSGGQGQLLALARAFYGDPSVLVLDEPNAALDQGGEALFHRAVKLARQKGKTVVIVTQRPSILPMVNKVLLMKDGAVGDYGPRDEVLQRNNVRAIPANKQATNKQATSKPAAGRQAASKPPANKSAPDHAPNNPQPHPGVNQDPAHRNRAATTKSAARRATGGASENISGSATEDLSNG